MVRRVGFLKNPKGLQGKALATARHSVTEWVWAWVWTSAFSTYCSVTLDSLFNLSGLSFLTFKMEMLINRQNSKMAPRPTLLHGWALYDLQECEYDGFQSHDRVMLYGTADFKKGRISRLAWYNQTSALKAAFSPAGHRRLSQRQTFLLVWKKKPQPCCELPIGSVARNVVAVRVTPSWQSAKKKKKCRSYTHKLQTEFDKQPEESSKEILPQNL